MNPSIKYVDEPLWCINYGLVKMLYYAFTVQVHSQYDKKYIYIFLFFAKFNTYNVSFDGCSNILFLVCSPQHLLWMVATDVFSLTGLSQVHSLIKLLLKKHKLFLLIHISTQLK